MDVVDDESHQPNTSTNNPIEEDMVDLNDSSSDIAASDEDLDALGEFCFETPRLSYKANDDYKDLLQAMVLWKSQLAHVKRDRNMLKKYREKSVADPFQFAESVEEGKMNFPKRQKIAPIPSIDLGKYRTSHVSSEKSCISSMDEADDEVDSNSGQKISQFWSEDEQKRLESLLLVYPPEEVETRRWEKIARALGTRTPRQVASRVQKYFIKLAKAGCAVPGRTPSMNYITKHKKRLRIGESHHQSKMSVTVESHEDIEVSDEEDIHAELRNTSEYQELILIKKIRKKKMELNDLMQQSEEG